jgi:hypothetical protein
MGPNSVVSGWESPVVNVIGQKVKMTFLQPFYVPEKKMPTGITSVWI